MLLTSRRLLRGFLRHFPGPFRADEAGATAIEYAVICTGIAATIIAILKSLGMKLTTSLTTLLSFFS